MRFQREIMKDFIKKVSILFMILFISIPLGFASMLFGRTASADGIETTQVGKRTKITQSGCSRKIETTEEINWSLPRKPIDLVILQDASGSFANTIPSVKKALKTLTTFVTEEQYDENNPRLVKTDNQIHLTVLWWLASKGWTATTITTTIPLQVNQLYILVGVRSMTISTSLLT